MIVPIQDIQGLVFNEYINLENALIFFKELGQYHYQTTRRKKNYDPRKTKGI